MKIEQKIKIFNASSVAIIALIGFFAFQNLNQILTKLRFMEIADDLNKSFLEMRLSEKNYFLYKDNTALMEIGEKIYDTRKSIALFRKDIIRAVGRKNLDVLNSYLNQYSAVINQAADKNSKGKDFSTKIRTEGKRLKEFSENIARLERKSVNKIINRSKFVLFFSFWALLISAVIMSQLISRRILKSLREIKQLTVSISEGDFKKMEGSDSRDEFGSIIKAINYMSEELKYREEQIIQSKKLASLGILTAGVAHELTNPLNNISMLSQTFQELYDNFDKEEMLDFMRKVDGETERMKIIIKDLLDFSKPKEPQLKHSDINQLLEKTLKLMQNSLDISNISIIKNLDRSLPEILIDANQIQQIFANLITNGVQAMPGGGYLIFSSELIKDQNLLQVKIADTGKGIQPEYLAHIFDPFFSTKGEGGSGLGLSISYRIMRKHQGDIKVQSELGVGTTFILQFII